MSRFLAISVLLVCSVSVLAQTKDRKAIVLRHNIVLTKVDSLSSIILGNGKFAFSTDVTGLQTFISNYQKGAPLETESEWGWHHFMNAEEYQKGETSEAYHSGGPHVDYGVQGDLDELNDNPFNLFHQNSHPLQLGNLGFEITKKDGTLATLSDVQNIYQELNLWTGKLRSHFTIEEVPVEVATYCSGTDDAIGIKVHSPLVTEGRLKIKLVFSYPSNQWNVEETTNYENEDKHQSKVLMSHDNGAVAVHQIDTTKYYVGFKWEGSGFIEQKKPHYFLIAPDTRSDLFDLTAKFTSKKDLGFLPTFIDVKTSSEVLWKNFWNNNRAITSSEHSDTKKIEAEKTVVLSQYLIKSTGALKRTGVTGLR
jgi:hypothetical protein